MVVKSSSKITQQRVLPPSICFRSLPKDRLSKFQIPTFLSPISNDVFDVIFLAMLYPIIQKYVKCIQNKNVCGCTILIVLPSRVVTGKGGGGMGSAVLLT